MKRLFTILLLLAAATTATSQTGFSGTQKHLLDLAANYQRDCAKAATQAQKDTARNSYTARLAHFIIRDREYQLDHMEVMVDSVLHNGLIVTTQFHTGPIVLRYTMEFTDSTGPQTGPLYRWMTQLQPQSTITAHFLVLEEIILNLPAGPGKHGPVYEPVVYIGARPEPVK